MATCVPWRSAEREAWSGVAILRGCPVPSRTKPAPAKPDASVGASAPTPTGRGPRPVGVGAPALATIARSATVAPTFTSSGNASALACFRRVRRTEREAAVLFQESSESEDGARPCFGDRADADHQDMARMAMPQHPAPCETTWPPHEAEPIQEKAFNADGSSRRHRIFPRPGRRRRRRGRRKCDIRTTRR